MHHAGRLGAQDKAWHKEWVSTQLHTYLPAACERGQARSTRSRPPGRRSRAGAPPAPAAHSWSLRETPRAGGRHSLRPLRSASSPDSASTGEGRAVRGSRRPCLQQSPPSPPLGSARPPREPGPSWSSGRPCGQHRAMGMAQPRWSHIRGPSLLGLGLSREQRLPLLAVPNWQHSRQRALSTVGI